MKVRKINSFENGMTPDEYKGGDGYFYYGEGVNIRKRSKQIFLNNSKTNLLTLDTGVNEYITGILEDSGNNVECTRTGNIYGQFFGKIYDRITSGGYRNMVKVNSGGTNYGVLFSDTAIDRWTYDSTSNSLGILGANALNNSTFSSTSDWTIGGTTTGWTGFFGYAQHTAGNTDTLTNSGTVANGTIYTLRVYIQGRTAGSVTITFGGQTTGAISSNGTSVFTRLTTSTASFVITPTSAFDGLITYTYLNVMSVTESYNSLSFTSSTYKPVYVQGNTFLFVGSANTLDRIDLTASPRTKSTMLTFKTGEIIRGITRIGETFIIYTNDGNDGYQYFRDGLSTSYDRQIIWYGLPIINVANMGNFDYVFCYKTYVSFMYKSMGYDRQLLFKSNYRNNDNKNIKRFQFYPDTTNAVETINNIVYFPDYLGSTLSDGHIYGYGDLLPGQQPGLNNELTFTGTLVNITSLLYTTSGYNLFVGYQEYSGGVYNNYLYASYLPETNTTYGSTGYIETLRFHGDDYSKKKSLVKIRLGYYLPNSSRNIKVYYSVEGGAYTLMKTITDTTLKTITIEGDTAGITFYELQLKFEINNASGNSETGYIALPITIRYNDDERD